MFQRSDELREQWALEPDTSGFEQRVLVLLHDIRESGFSVEDDHVRAALGREIDSWQTWFAAERGELIKPKGIRPFVVDDPDTFTAISVEELVDQLALGNSVYQRKITGGSFASVGKTRLANAFANGKVVDCEFEGCSFEDANFGDGQVPAGAGASLIYVAFAGCEWGRVRWPGLRASSLAFEDAPNVYGADFEGANFADVLFRNFGGERLIFLGATFTECKLSNATFTQSAFTGATFTRCVFEGVVFNGSDLSQSAFHGCDLRGTEFAGGTLMQTLFSECALGGVITKVGRAYGRHTQTAPITSDTRVETSFDVPLSLLPEPPVAGASTSVESSAAKSHDTLRLVEDKSPESRARENG